MGKPIKLIVGEMELIGELNQSDTARVIYQSLPLDFTGDYWGDELYGSIGIEVEEEASVEVVGIPGTLAYWPVGNAFCLFWGATPVSREGEMRAASPVNVIGKIVDGLEEFIEQRPKAIFCRIERV